jgi:hypothetical protein
LQYAGTGGYSDDVDYGVSFTYTGEGIALALNKICVIDIIQIQGGRDLKGTRSNPKNLRTGPQTKDQVLERGNLALAKSCM